MSTPITPLAAPEHLSLHPITSPNRLRHMGLRFAESDEPNEGGENEPDENEPDEQEQPVEGEDALGDKGKKALLAMKAERNTARQEAAAAKAERDRLQAEIDGKQAEFEQRQAAERLQAEALEKANDRIRRAEVRAAAAGKLADPADALQFLDLSSLEVGDDGEVDSDAVAALIDDLVEKKPYLKAQGGRFQGEGGSGPRNEDKAPQQLTQADLESMTDEQIRDARKAGKLDKLLGVSS